MQIGHLKVIVADDSDFALNLMRDLLHAYDLRDITEARTGREAIDAIATTSPDIALLDWVMPDLDGLAVTRWIRHNKASPNVFMPVILVTAHASRRNVLRALSAGINGFLRKPLSAAQLNRQIVRQILRPMPFVRAGAYFGPAHAALGHGEPRNDEPRNGEPHNGAGGHAASMDTAPRQVVIEDVKRSGPDPS